ncbi:hypothetical protein [Candidatus Enterovibrio escicola]
MGKYFLSFDIKQRNKPSRLSVTEFTKLKNPLNELLKQGVHQL